MTQWNEAIDHYTFAIDLLPSFSSIPYTNRGVAFIYNNNEERALEDFTKAIELNKKSVVRLIIPSFFLIVILFHSFQNNSDHFAFLNRGQVRFERGDCKF
jgi:tetratricopeptide (TPR) repeat protein